MKIMAGKIIPNKTLLIFILFTSLIFLETGYAGQEKIVPDNTPSGIIKDICLIATPRLAKIPELYGRWNPAFPWRTQSIWNISGSDSADTIMSYAEIRREWPYTYLRYTAKGQSPNNYWDQDKTMEAYYFNGSINVTVSTGGWRSSWRDDWQKSAEAHNRTYANQTQTVYAMGPAPKVKSEVLPGPIKTCEFKQKQYCGGRFQAELQIFRDKYQLERYASAGSGVGTYRIIQRIMDRNYITNIKAQVKGTNPAIEISLNAVTRDSKPVDEALVDRIINTILGAAYEASGMPNPCADIDVPGEEEEQVTLHPVCEDAQVSGDLVGHITATWENVRVLRPGGDSGQIELRPWKGMPLFEGDSIITKGEDSQASIQFYGENIRAGWQRSVTYYHWDKYGNPQAPIKYRVPSKEDVTDFINTLHPDERRRYFIALSRDGLEMTVGPDSYTSLCVDAFLAEDDPPKSIWIRLKEGLMWSIKRQVELSPTQIHINMTIPGSAGLRGTEVVIQNDPESNVASIHVNEGEVSFTRQGDDRARIVSAGKSIVVRGDNQPQILSLNPNIWKQLTKKLNVPQYEPISENERFIRAKAPKDYIPDLKAVVTDVRFFEGGKDGVARGQREYREGFNRSDSRYIYWELNLRFPAPGRRLDFDIDAVWYGPDGSEFARHTLNTYMDKTWTDSFCSFGRGREKPGNWKPGTYMVELFHKGQKIAISTFEINDRGGTDRQTTYDIPSISANVTEVRFFAGGFDAIPYNQRVYSDKFSKPYVRAIWWELNLEYPDPGRRIDFIIEAVFYRPDGSILTRQTHNTAIQSTWKTSYHSLGWGWREAGNWPLGTYRVELFVDGKRIGSGTFEIIMKWDDNLSIYNVGG